MKTISLRLLAAVMALLLAPGLRAQQPAGTPAPTPPIATGGELAAMPAAEIWLALVDDGQFDKSWDTAAKILRNLVKKDEWIKLAKVKRPPLGKVVSRKLAESTPAKTFPGAPEGTYVALQYNTEFERKKVARETVTVAVDVDGQWRVCGYYIR